jgi:hypothetical protein
MQNAGAQPGSEYWTSEGLTTSTRMTATSLSALINHALVMSGFKRYAASM